MADFDLTLALNGRDIPAQVHTREDGDVTYYEVLIEDYTLTLYKDTLYTWTSDDPHGLNQADIQSVGEQLQNY